MRVLIVEDEMLVAMRLAKDMEANDFVTIGPVATVAQALDRIDEADTAVLDVNLGKELSFPIADALQDQGTPFVFLTGYRERSVPSRHEAAPRLSKPVDVEALSAVLRSLH